MNARCLFCYAFLLGFWFSPFARRSRVRVSGFEPSDQRRTRSDRLDPSSREVGTSYWDRARTALSRVEPLSAVANTWSNPRFARARSSGNFLRFYRRCLSEAYSFLSRLESQASYSLRVCLCLSASRSVLGDFVQFHGAPLARFLSSRPCSSRSPSGLVGLSLSQLCHPHDFGLRRPRSGGPDGPVVDFARGRRGCILCDGSGSSFGLDL